ncbi:MAG: L,D-transpeptidase family protein [Pseudomonadota bacterium]
MMSQTHPFTNWSARSCAILLVVGFVGLVSATAAHSFSIAFKQGIAEAARSDRSITDFYRLQGYAPVWTDPDKGPARRQALFVAIDRASLHGIPAGRYDTNALAQVLGEARSDRDLGAVEVSLTRTFLRLARDLQTGFLDPREVVEAIKRDVEPSAVSTLLNGFIGSDPHVFMTTLPPTTPEYRALLREKLRLEAIIERGGWGPSLRVRKLEPGDSGAAVVALRDRLNAMGYVTQSVAARYDLTLEAAIRTVQADHGLEVDGIAGKSTLTAINRSAPDRLKAVLVAMERERWLSAVGDRGARHILVNLADFSARVFDDGTQTFYTRAVVGMNRNGPRSPEFSDEMEHMVINPTWHVPRSIAVKEYLPKLRANPNAVGHLRMVNSRGQVVSRKNIDFSAYGPRSFPYAMKQPPSSSNALGLVKFMFPNEYNIYLHDTPHKKLFARETRAYSHGCIRLSDPFGFAYHLLARQEADPEAFFQATLDTGRETYVDLDQTVPVHIIYRTAVSDARGKIGYRADVYGRDAKIWKALARTGVSLPGLQG